MSTYIRGTKTHKVTSSSLREGAVLLTTHPDARGNVQVAQTKTGAILRTVERIQRSMPGQYERTVRILVHFTDGTVSDRCAPSQTWMSTGIEA